MHTALNDRLEAAALLVSAQIKGPVVVDAMHDPSIRMYGALPERLVLISPDGTLAYFGDHGPWGYSLPQLDDFLTDMTY